MAHLPIEAQGSGGCNVDGFRLEQLQAEGGYERVFRAVDSQSGSDVVVKFPKPAVLAEPAMREAFVREALIGVRVASRSEEHTSELQSLMRISYAVLCLKKKRVPITQI